MLTLFASNVICTLISPLTASPSNGCNLMCGAAWVPTEHELHGMWRTTHRMEIVAKGRRVGGIVKHNRIEGCGLIHLLIPLVHGMIVYESRLDLDGPEESVLRERAVIYAEGNDGLLGGYITTGHEDLSDKDAMEMI